MPRQPPATLALLHIAIHLLIPLISSHGLLTNPRQRGAFVVKNRLVSTLNPLAPFDPYAHFPSGSKSIKPGSGKRSVIHAANRTWSPYTPLRSGYPWRAGVCGDELSTPQQHLKGGRYYFPQHNPIRAATYEKAAVVTFESNIVVHHNGFFEFFICNIDACGRDISPYCFENGHCQQLMRAPSFCDKANSNDCGPIDHNYLGRWYLPCGPFPNGQILYGADTPSITYQLPDNLVCDHCVLQWYWTSANTCNPPGVVEYFEGPDKPNWPKCPGQGDALGGYTNTQFPCEGDRFPEEYWQCADVRIVDKQNQNDGNDNKQSPSLSTVIPGEPFDITNVAPNVPTSLPKGLANNANDTGIKSESGADQADTFARASLQSQKGTKPFSSPAPNDDTNGQNNDKSKATKSIPSPGSVDKPLGSEELDNARSSNDTDFQTMPPSPHDSESISSEDDTTPLAPTVTPRPVNVSTASSNTQGQIITAKSPSFNENAANATSTLPRRTPEPQLDVERTTELGAHMPVIPANARYLQSDQPKSDPYNVYHDGAPVHNIH